MPQTTRLPRAHGPSRVCYPSISVIGAGLIAWAVLTGIGCAPEAVRCAICHMPIPDETRVTVRIDGRRAETVCDARCPLTLQEQTDLTVELISVTDFLTGERLDAERALFVTGSDTAPDAHSEEVRTTPSDNAFLHWHRCLPSILAFRGRADAARFQQSHGGRVMTLAELGFANGA